MTPKHPSRRLALLLLVALPARADHGGIDGPEEFAQLARGGFEEVVNGTPGVLVPNALGSSSNSYPWSLGWFNGQLYVGTVRDVLCFLSGQDTSTVTCDLGENGELPLPGADQRAEVWRYTPGGVGGIAGTWQRVFQSPFVSFPVNQFVPPETPRDVGYRGMCVSTVGGGAPKLFVATLGVPGRILYWDGSTFQQASTLGLRASALDLAANQYDLGYRSLVEFNGRLWTSPVGTITDTDTSTNPVVLANSNPVGPSPWQTILNVASDPTLGDPDNSAVFQMSVHGGFLYLAVTNRATGLEIWRTNGLGCTNPFGDCTPTWDKIIVNGGSRPPDGNSPVIDNTTGELGGFGDYMYVASSEAAAFDSTTSEMMRIRPDGKWELVVGWTRMDYATIPNLACATPVDADGDTAVDDCRPLSGRAPGMGSNLTTQGSALYFWRLTSHDGKLYAGTLDTGNGSAASPAGFDLWSTPDGVTWTRNVDDGIGNPLNYGVRGLLSTGVGLFLGAANPYTDEPRGGLEVFLGTTVPSVPPVAVAGADKIVFDDENSPAPGNFSVTTSLDGSKSNAPFGGHLATHAWYQGDLVGQCASISAPAIATTPTVSNLVLATGAVATQHAFTLKVTDDEGRSHCDSVVITASHDLLPIAAIATEPPTVRRGSRSRLRLIDFDGNGSETFRAIGTCSDPEGLLASCTWSADTGLAIDTSDMDTMATAEAAAGGEDRELSLTVVDQRGYSRTATIDVNVETVPADVADVNDEPRCQSAVRTIVQDQPFVIDAVDPQARLCIDPDDADATLVLEERGDPPHGSLTEGPLTYTPDPGFAGVDVAAFRACDDEGACSSTVAIQFVVLADGDGDGIADVDDTCPGLANPDNADFDDDGLGDACDNCAMYANPQQETSTCDFDWADVAPRAAPDGVVRIADLVQLVRYMNGIDAMTPEQLRRSNVAPATAAGSVLTPTLALPRVVTSADRDLVEQAALGQVTFSTPE